MQRQVIIIHGGTTYASYEEYLRDLKRAKIDFERLMQRGWKDSFATKLGKGFQVIQPKMPNPSNATYAEWAIWFRKIVPFFTDEVVLVGHSLGGIFLAKYLATHTLSKKISAVILIAAPFESTSEETLGDFTLPRSLKKFAHQAGHIFVYHSVDDPVVPIAHAHQYLNALPTATGRIFKNKAHFNQPTFPELVREIRELHC